MAVVQIRIGNYFLHFKLFVRNITNQIGYTFIDSQFYSSWVKSQKLEINYVFFQIPGTKKFLAQLGTYANIQNNFNDIKLSSCTFRLRRNKISEPTKVLQPRKFFRSFLSPTLHTSSVFRPLITG